MNIRAIHGAFKSVTCVAHIPFTETLSCVVN